MFEILSYDFVRRAIIASVLGGITCGVVGVWVVLLNIPFVGVAMSHSAFAGAVVGILLGINPLLSALIFCFAASILIGPVADKGDVSMNMSIGVIFSLVLGIAFLGMGLIKGPKTEALDFLWGSILTVSTSQVYMLCAVAVLILAVLILFYREILAVLFNREIAKAAGIPEKAVLYMLLFLCGITVTLNLNTIGGLLIFSLITSSPLSAYQLTYDLKKMYFLSAVFGVAACLSGLYISYLLNVPSGAVIIIVSSAIFAVCLYVSPKRSKTREP